uniref:Uncharacterized protein n=1 Tax=Acrobeloides nanus TaxID=290746 RepID=A0A914E0S1_9BILA
MVVDLMISVVRQKLVSIDSNTSFPDIAINDSTTVSTLLNTETKSTASSHWVTSHIESTIIDSHAVGNQHEDLIIDRKSVIGTGEFAIVYKGHLTSSNPELRRFSMSQMDKIARNSHMMPKKAAVKGNIMSRTRNYEKSWISCPSSISNWLSDFK